jgi:hypothetical protein
LQKLNITAKKLFPGERVFDIDSYVEQLQNGGVKLLGSDRPRSSDQKPITLNFMETDGRERNRFWPLGDPRQIHVTSDLGFNDVVDYRKFLVHFNLENAFDVNPFDNMAHIKIAMYSQLLSQTANVIQGEPFVVERLQDLVKTYDAMDTQRGSWFWSNNFLVKVSYGDTSTWENLHRSAYCKKHGLEAFELNPFLV